MSLSEHTPLHNQKPTLLQKGPIVPLNIELEYLSYVWNTRYARLYERHNTKAFMIHYYEVMLALHRETWKIQLNIVHNLPGTY